MLKNFLDGVAKKLGESVGTWLAPFLFVAVATLWLWLRSSEPLQVSRRGLVLWGVLSIALVVAAYALGYFLAKRRYTPPAVAVPEVDMLQRIVLCFLWERPQNTTDFGTMRVLTAVDPSELTLAGERLQEMGLIAYQPGAGDNALMQLVRAGREYIKLTGLDKHAARAHEVSAKRLLDWRLRDVRQARPLLATRA
jgi:DNA-binding MarR family transcriptional regulator